MRTAVAAPAADPGPERQLLLAAIAGLLGQRERVLALAVPIVLLSNLTTAIGEWGARDQRILERSVAGEVLKARWDAVRAAYRDAVEFLGDIA